MGQGFQIDILNLAGQSIIVSCTPIETGTLRSFNAGGIGPTSLGAGQSLSQVNPQKAPQYFELSSTYGRAAVAVASAGSALPRGVTLNFQDTKTIVKDGVVYFQNQQNLWMTLKNGLIVSFAVYLSTWGKWTEGLIVLGRAYATR